MASEREDDKRSSGLSITTLIIAALASAVAAIIVRKIWGPGTIFASAFTPVLVALVSEALKRPTERIEAVTSRRRTRVIEITDDPARPGEEHVVPPPDEDEPGPEFSPREVYGGPGGRRKLWIALATGLAAFAIAAVVLSATEVLAGGSVTGGGRDTTFFGGDRTGQRDEGTETTTQTTTAPVTVTQTVPAEPVPEEDTGTTAPAPEGTTTIPAPTQTAPAPGDTAPPEAPAPVP